MTTKKIAEILEQRFKGDIHISVDTVKEFIKNELNSPSFTVLDVSHEYRFRCLKTTIKLKSGKYGEFYIKPV